MFFIKPSTIHLDCFTNNPIVYQNFKVEQAREFIPSWWRNLPLLRQVKANNDPNSKITIAEINLKQCYGFRDLFAEGFIIPFWADIKIEMHGDGKYYITGHNVPTVNINATTHPRWQTGNEIYQDCSHLKIDSPWFFEEKSGVKFSWNACMWNNTSYLNDAHILSGVLDFKTQKSTNLNMFIKNGSVVTLNAGDPMVHLIPISDKKIKIHNHLISDEEFGKKWRIEVFANDYFVTRVKKMKNEEPKKCPFGFGR